MKKIVVSVIVAGLIGGGYLAHNQNILQTHNLFTLYPTQSVTQASAPSLQGNIPVKLYIPAIQVEASIESVGNDSTGRMAVPALSQDVAWYQFGPKPGEIGQAVIDGHVDTATGSAIFVNLKHIHKGDEIIVTNQQGINLTFKVYDIKIYSDQNFPLTTVFGPSNTAQLNLITCTGSFNRQQMNYSDRLVIFSQLEE